MNKQRKFVATSTLSPTWEHIELRTLQQEDDIEIILDEVAANAYQLFCKAKETINEDTFYSSLSILVSGRA